MLNPLNIDNINKSVNKTGKILTIDTGYKKLGVGSEIISRIIENNISYTLKAARLGLPDHPTPSSIGLIKNYYPSSIEILKKIINLINLSQLKNRELLKLFSKIDNQNKYIDIPDPSFKGPF